MKISEETIKQFIIFQKDELTTSEIYQKIANQQKDLNNKEVLESFAKQEYEHAMFFKELTKVEVTSNKFKVLLYAFLNFVFGYTFTIRLIEKHEKYTMEDYRKYANEVENINDVVHNISKHKDILDSLVNENKLEYIGAIVLGLNDALVELTGTIAGLTFALANTRLVALSGIVTGISATLSMAASNYLAEKAESNPNALKSSVYTGVAYLVAVILMVLPYLIFSNENYVYALIGMLSVVILIIVIFNYYISVAKDESFAENFFTMAALSLGVALVAFFIGMLAKRFLGVEI